MSSKKYLARIRWNHFFVVTLHEKIQVSTWKESFESAEDERAITFELAFSHIWLEIS
jgi:hypothetical protein